MKGVVRISDRGERRLITETPCSLLGAGMGGGKNYEGGRLRKREARGIIFLEEVNRKEDFSTEKVGPNKGNPLRVIGKDLRFEKKKSVVLGGRVVYSRQRSEPPQRQERGEEIRGKRTLLKRGRGEGYGIYPSSPARKKGKEGI